MAAEIKQWALWFGLVAGFLLAVSLSCTVKAIILPAPIVVVDTTIVYVQPHHADAYVEKLKAGLDMPFFGYHIVDSTTIEVLFDSPYSGTTK